MQGKRLSLKDYISHVEINTMTKKNKDKGKVTKGESRPPKGKNRPHGGKPKKNY